MMAQAPSLRGASETVWESVAPFLPDFTVEVLAEIDSTNSELMRRARASQVQPILLVAERQIAGRGRLGRDWFSEVDGAGRIDSDSNADLDLPSLTCSLGLPVAPCDLSGLSLAVGLSVVESLHPRLRLKWPNDVLLDGRKLAGILIETVQVGSERFVVIGIGVNIRTRPDDGLRTPSAALRELLPDCNAGWVLQQIIPPLVKTVQRLVDSGFGVFRTAYHARDALYGCVVQTSAAQEGVARGVDATGALLVHTASGVEKVSSAEVSVRAVPLTDSTKP